MSARGSDAALRVDLLRDFTVNAGRPMWRAMNATNTARLNYTVTYPTRVLISLSRTSTVSDSFTAMQARLMTGITRPATGRPVSGRPSTTRPQTARPLTAASTRHEGSYVIAVLEARGVGREVGLAALDRETGRVMLVQVSETRCLGYPELTLSQLADCQTYVKTLHQMHLHLPLLILVPDTFLSISDGKPSSLLVQYIQEEFPFVTVEPVARKYWNDSVGEWLRRNMRLQTRCLQRHLIILQDWSSLINFVSKMSRARLLF